MSAPTLGPAARVREQVLQQHGMLRERLQALADAARAVVGERDPALAEQRTRQCLEPELRAFLELLAMHLAFEESVLAPLLDAAAPPGESWGAHLVEDHDRQRDELRTMAEVAVAGERDDPVGVAFAVEAFLSDLRIDMELEEQQCLTPAVLHDPDEVVVVDQASE
jgi:iron-sulfur cluster repair protein YtfE (RIC family)